MNKGQSMFEVILALGVVTLITVAIVILSANATRNSSFSKNKTLSSRFAQEAIEWLRKEREKNSAVFFDRALQPNYCFDTLAWTNVGPCSSTEKISGTILTRQVNLSTTLISGKKIMEAVVIVNWSDSQGYHEARSTTNFSDAREQ